MTALVAASSAALVAARSAALVAQNQVTAALDEVKAKRAVLQKKAETGSLVAKNAALNPLALLRHEDGILPQIDCYALFVLIGPF